MSKNGSFTKVILSNKTGGKTSFFGEPGAPVLDLIPLQFHYINRLLTAEFPLCQRQCFFLLYFLTQIYLLNRFLLG